MVGGKNHIFLVKNVKSLFLLIGRELFNEEIVPPRMVIKIANLNQKGRRIIGNFLNIPHEMCMPPKMANGSNNDIPVNIK